jgi:hypothetical protein
VYACTSRHLEPATGAAAGPVTARDLLR